MLDTGCWMLDERHGRFCKAENLHKPQGLSLRVCADFRLRRNCPAPISKIRHPASGI